MTGHGGEAVELKFKCSVAIFGETIQLFADPSRLLVNLVQALVGYWTSYSVSLEFPRVSVLSCDLEQSLFNERRTDVDRSE